MLSKRLKDNLLVMKNANAIIDLINNGDAMSVHLIKEYFFRMNDVDKNLLTSRNLGMYEAMEAVFENKNIVCFVKPTTGYRNGFFRMITVLCNHKFLYGMNCDNKDEIVVDEGYAKVLSKNRIIVDNGNMQMLPKC